MRGSTVSQGRADGEELSPIASDDSGVSTANIIVAEMLRNTTDRVEEAVARERALVIAWGKRHPDMPLGLAVKFLAQGEHLK